jgi:choline dehydrogenase-like flavoprotein
MILDSYDLSDGHALQADVCIIGAGAAGIAMALDLVNTGIEVLLLEAGGRTEESDTQALYAGSVADARLHSQPDRYRQRQFGGTTTIWGGRCMPFDAIDFETRDYVPHSGWPLSREALLPYYTRANPLCEAGEFSYTAEEAFHRPTRSIIDGFASIHFTADTLERFSCPTDFAARYGHKLEAAQNVRTVLHANVTRLQLNAAGRSVDHALVRNLRGKSFTVRAAQFVLATGGLEVARLLLASRDIQQQGIGNQHDVVGRYYMCHIAGTIGAVKIDRPPSAVWHGYEISDEGIYCRRRFALREATQRSLGLGNFIARLHHPRISNPDHRNAVLSLLFLAQLIIPYEYRVRLAGAESTSLAQWLQHIRNVALGTTDAAGFAWHMLRDRRLAERKFPTIIIHSKANLYSLDFHAEQQPNPASRVSLSAEADALGMPRISVDWRYTPGDVDTVRRSVALLAEDFRLQRIGTFDYDPDSVEAEVTRYGAFGGHHIGTARMGADPRSSVVNSDCRLHDVGNLFIASSATFPTSSQANPTLTIVAFALRLSAHLKTLLKRPQPQGPVTASAKASTGASLTAGTTAVATVPAEAAEPMACGDALCEPS